MDEKIATAYFGVQLIFSANIKMAKKSILKG